MMYAGQGEGSFSPAGSGNRRQLQIPESVPTILIWKWISLGTRRQGVGGLWIKYKWKYGYLNELIIADLLY